MIIFKSEREIQHMREAGRIVALALRAVREAVAPGSPRSAGGFVGCSAAARR